MSCTPFSLDLAADQSALPHYQPPPCQVACPIGTDVASYVGMIWAGDIPGALDAITATNPFSSVCGRVCDAPCEPACRRANADGAVAIRGLKRYVMDRLGADFKLPAITPDKSQRVAIIGAGPAGLTAAQDIAAAGYLVDVYEALPKAGGMMAWGIPDFRLPPAVVDQDVQRILDRCPGITLHLSTALGQSVHLADLQTSHAAILLTIGASAGRRLGVAGDDAATVIDGVTFLNGVNGGDRPTLPAHVVVVGGGDVAMDACRTARRLPGVQKVTVLYRRGPDEIPARKHEISAALAEGIEIRYNVAPQQVTENGLICVQTVLGAPGADGRRAFSTVAGSEFAVECGLVIAAVGQKSVSLELAQLGLLDGDKIATDETTMRTRAAKVYAAGDAAFGSSTIVQAMFQGHKAAYYMVAALKGEAHPAPYKTPYRTRNVPVAQDQQWEKLGLVEPRFLGLRDDAWADTEEGYGEQTAIQQAARCYRCDTETGSADYTVKAREAIFSLARQDVTVGDLRRLTAERMASRPDPFLGDRRPTLDELVFLPANLTRLVIDPYRESCRTKTVLGAGLELDHPLLIGGFDSAPETVKAAVAQAVISSNGGYVGRRPIGGGAKWVQLIDDAAQASRDADTVVATRLIRLDRLHPCQSLGLLCTRQTMAEAVPFALANGFDLLLLDGCGAIDLTFGELAGPPDLSLLVETVKMLRAANQEESLSLVWMGGIRSGSDLAKLMSLGANAAVASVAAAVSLGGQISDGVIGFPDQVSAEPLSAFLKACVSEVSMMARCTGKTDIRNLEPEDLRSLSLAAQSATGIVMAGVKKIA